MVGKMEDITARASWSNQMEIYTWVALLMVGITGMVYTKRPKVFSGMAPGGRAKR